MLKPEVPSRWPVLAARVLARLPLLLVVAGLIVNAAYLVLLARDLWFFGDDWDFLLRRGLVGEYEFSIWKPHNEHWSTVPIVLFRLVFGMVGLDHYLPYALLPITAHVVLWVLMYALLRRVGVAAWPAAVATLVGAFLGGGVGAENTLWDFQIGFIGSAMFGVGALLVATGESRRRLVATWALLVLSLMSAGPGLIFVGWTALQALLRTGLSRAIAIASVPLAAYAIWFAVIGHDVAALPKVPVLFPFRAASGMAAVWSNALAMPGAGPVVLVLLVLALCRPAVVRSQFALGAAGLVAFAVAFVLFGYARSGLGPGASEASRYLYFGIVFTIPALAIGADAAAARLASRPWARPLVLGLVLFLASGLGLAQAHQFAEARRPLVEPLRTVLAGTIHLLRHDEPLVGGVPDATYNPDITVAHLDRPEFEGIFDTEPGDGAVLEARGRLQVFAGNVPVAGLQAPARLQWHGVDGALVEVTPRGCRSRTVGPGGGAVDVPVAAGGVVVEVTAADPSAVRTVVIDAEGSSEPRAWSLQTGPVPVGSVAVGTVLRIQLPPGPVTLCSTS